MNKRLESYETTESNTKNIEFLEVISLPFIKDFTSQSIFLKNIILF